MNFGVERPYAFYAFIVLACMLLFTFGKYSRLVRALKVGNVLQKDGQSFRRLRRCFMLRSIFLTLAASSCILAYAGISWGTDAVPVQKNGRAVSLVFDISYSMLARDANGGKTRLASAAAFAGELLDNMEHTSVSVVLAKGDGSVAVPMTEDMEAVYGLLANLAPSLMTSSGSSLGKGIEAAITSFPVQSSQAGFIWLFTDGEETDESLLPALNDAVRYGIPVAIIGFGSEEGAEITAGDGKTKVQTALRSASLEKTISSVQVRNVQKNHHQLIPSVQYLNAAQKGSAYRLLHSLRSETSGGTASSEDDTSVAYELESVRHQNLFIILTLVFLCFAFITGELNIRDRRRQLTAVLGMTFVAMMFSGCTVQMKNRWELLEGHLDWNRKNYQDAISCFLNVYESAAERNDEMTRQYALYGLAVTYFMQDESDAALDRFSQIVPDAPDEVRFAVVYNTGILAHRKGDYAAAADCFRQALSINSADVNAKINLELSLREDNVQKKAQETSLSPVAENNAEGQALENALYSIMREKEQDQWKKQEQETTENSASDY